MRALWIEGGPEGLPPPPRVCESCALVRATAGVVSAAFGTGDFGGSFSRWSMNIEFFLWFGSGSDIVWDYWALPPPSPPFLSFGGGDRGST